MSLPLFYNLLLHFLNKNHSFTSVIVFCHNAFLQLKNVVSRHWAKELLHYKIAWQAQQLAGPLIALDAGRKVCNIKISCLLSVTTFKYQS